MAPQSAAELVAEHPRRGVLLILSSPSGAGKSTLTRALLDTDDQITLSISATTRAKRPSEADGVHYRFLKQRDFDVLRDAGELLEHAEVHGNSYGTPKEPVVRALEEGRDVLFDIDWQGTLQVRNAMPDDVATVFILPPSVPELKARLERRAENTPEDIKRRLRNAAVEIERGTDYDYVVINDDFERCLNEVRAILQAERLKRVRQPGLNAFAASLIGALSGD
ncbi:guanylate kinase [Methylopila jiangsuensis]|uniref:Guanylate kinase n=1 Tax=Methylopila jiangsuensis TaxID=586230 RepID=A0A9W6JJY4_9HYPH|nr:guanylate kinase [Methylopila jiangsuensis]MDR6286756.1 guanylate kinase [Methylopila jiangsuensis]GLK76898.1 guanylate kinase [Methylopila jiangsuensis]